MAKNAEDSSWHTPRAIDRRRQITTLKEGLVLTTTRERSLGEFPQLSQIAARSSQAPVP